jgi:hypothetical protein
MISRTFATAWGVRISGAFFSVSCAGATVVAMFSPISEIADAGFTLLVPERRFKAYSAIFPLDATVGAAVADVSPGAGSGRRHWEKVVSTLITKAITL